MDFAFFDRTARGRLIVTGRDRNDLIHRLCTNAVVGLEKGRGVPACFCTNRGRLIDWTVILERGDDLLILSGNPERLAGHILQYTISEDVTVRNYMAIEILACGPKAREVLGVDLDRWSFTERAMAGVKVQIVRVEPLLGDAYVILAPDAVALRRVLAEHGPALEPAQVEEFRVRAGIPAHPSEINEEHNPWEARLDEAISLRKGCYVGQEVIARLNTYDKVQRRLVGLRLDEPRPAGGTLSRDGGIAGLLTTVSGRIALGYVQGALAEPGTALDGARVVALPMPPG
jgi:folate-binding protein YgfZ